MQFGRGVQDLVGFLFEAGASEERRLHQQSSQVAGMGREIRFACSGGTLVIPARGEGFRAMEFSRGIPHLGRSRKGLRRLREKSARELGVTQPHPGRRGLELDRGFPDALREIGMAEPCQERSLVLPRRSPRGRMGSVTHVIGDTHPDDRAASLRIQTERLAHSLERGPVRMLDLREGRHAHVVTSRQRARISHSSQPGSPTRSVPKHS